MTAPQQRGQITYTEQPPPEFSYEEYLVASALISAWVTQIVLGLAAPWQGIPMTRGDWLQFLATVYPTVEDARRAFAELSRRFYDSERARVLGPDLVEVPSLFDDLPVQFDPPLRQRMWPRLNINLAPYEPAWFEEAMDAVVLDFVKPNATDGSVVNVISQTIKEAENGGRRTTLWAVQDDPKVLGWARVEGNENVGSCGFCAMLISRGPVYSFADTAGLDIAGSDRLAVEAFRQSQATGVNIPEEFMTRWHPNCDCKVVPVFKHGDWPGRDQYLAMSALWAEVMRDFQDEHGRPPRQGKVGRDAPAETREALNAFRRRIERGDLPANITRPRAA